jgi:NifU-like protein involved in Fe-S cluster formation
VATRVSSKLYTPELLTLATALASFPLKGDLPLRAEARSRTCGSALRLGLSLDDKGLVFAVGMRVSACAIGQASAALLAQGAEGRSPTDISLTAAALDDWLSGAGDLPTWPGLEALVPARDHPGRHGALLLPWKAAFEALSSALTPR